MAFSAGATDEVSHSMGQQRVQLGMHVVATALPADDESSMQPEDVVLYFGIIDILQVTLHAAALPSIFMCQHQHMDPVRTAS